MFGNILTKLRNRLGTKKLAQLAEIKMHLRDEHLRDGKVKNRIQRVFGALREGIHPMAQVPGSRDEEESFVLSTSQQEMQTIASRLQDLSTVDGVDSLDLDNLPEPSNTHVTLKELFDYECISEWQQHQQMGTNGLLRTHPRGTHFVTLAPTFSHISPFGIPPSLAKAPILIL